MSLAEFLPTLKDLSRKEKFEAVQFLLADLENEEKPNFSLGGVYEVWAPIEGGAEAAVAMEKLLEEHRLNARKV